MLSNGNVCEMDASLKNLEDSGDLINGDSAVLRFE